LGCLLLKFHCFTPRRIFMKIPINAMMNSMGNMIDTTENISKPEFISGPINTPPNSVL
jgi:hypothetical protein